MTATVPAGSPATPVTLRVVAPPRGPERGTRRLIHAILVVVTTIIAVVLYGVLSGAVSPPAPRTRAEAALYSAAATVRQRPTDGMAWADYAEAQYATGAKDKAWRAIADGRKQVKGSTVRQLNVAEVHLLIMDGKNKQAIDRTTTYIQQDIDVRVDQTAKNFEHLIVVPYWMQDNSVTVNMFVLRGTAQGNLKQWKDAIVSFDNALRFEPQAADVIVLRGFAKTNAGDRAGAKKDFELALKFLPNDAAALKGLADLGVE